MNTLYRNRLVRPVTLLDQCSRLEIIRPVEDAFVHIASMLGLSQWRLLMPESLGKGRPALLVPLVTTDLISYRDVDVYVSVYLQLCSLTNQILVLESQLDIAGTHS
jgi:hypothetical protein